MPLTMGIIMTLILQRHEKMKKWTDRKGPKGRVLEKSKVNPSGSMRVHFYVRIVHQTKPWSLRRRRLSRQRNCLSRPEKTYGLCRIPKSRSKRRPSVPRDKRYQNPWNLTGNRLKFRTRCVCVCVCFWGVGGRRVEDAGIVLTPDALLLRITGK